MKGRKQKISEDTWLQKDRAEPEGYAGGQTYMRITENNFTNTDKPSYGLLEQIVSPTNLHKAYKRVKSNDGSGGIDKMKVESLGEYLVANKEELIESILDGTYRPNPVRRVEIPKDNGKKRMLGIPTVVDRVVQQAITQVLSPIYEKQFSSSSFGFRPKRNAHQALKQCKDYITEGYKYAVDMDLEKFFDTVNQSKLIEILSRTVKDGRVVSLIHKYLKAGVVVRNKFEDTEIGVPQGGPLAPRTHLQTLNFYDELSLSGENFKFVNFIKSITFAINGKITELGISKTDQPGLCFIEQRQITARGSRVLNEKVWSITDTGISLCSTSQGTHRKDDNTGKFSGFYCEITLQPNQTGKGIGRNSWPNHQQCDKTCAGGIFGETGQWQKRSNSLRYPLSTTAYGSKSSHRHTISLFQRTKLLSTRKISLKLN
jgi:retron-type reverse transcriptase